MKLTGNRIGYYEPTIEINNHKKDLSSKELDVLKEKEDQKHAIMFLLTFAALVSFALLASYYLS